jgi:hypothetical protein
MATATASLSPPMPYDGPPRDGERILVVKQPWLDHILQGRKTMEIRACKLSPGPCLIGNKQLIYGRLILGESVVLDSPDLWKAHAEKHLCGDALYGMYKKPCGTIITCVLRILDPPVPFVHPMGAITWVTYRSQALSSGVGADHKAPSFPPPAAAVSLSTESLGPAMEASSSSTTAAELENLSARVRTLSTSTVPKLLRLAEELDARLPKKRKVQDATSGIGPQKELADDLAKKLGPLLNWADAETLDRLCIGIAHFYFEETKTLSAVSLDEKWSDSQGENFKRTLQAFDAAQRNYFCYTFTAAASSTRARRLRTGREERTRLGDASFWDWFACLLAPFTMRDRTVCAARTPMVWKPTSDGMGSAGDEGGSVSPMTPMPVNHLAPTVDASHQH